MANAIVFFDLDGTIINCQSQKELARYLYGRGFLKKRFFLKILFWFFLYKIGIVSDVSEIMRKSYSFLSGFEVSEFQKILKDFFEKEIKNKIYKQAINEINKHRESGRKIVIISNVIKPLAELVGEYLGVDYCLATVPEEKGGFYTGNINGDIIYGSNKERAIRKIETEKGWNLKEESHGYGDHYSDVFFLEKTKKPAVVNPDLKLKKIALEKKWQIYYWHNITNNS